MTLVASFDWDTASQGEPVSKREFDFLVEVQGDLDRPQLEQVKFSEYRWLGAEELELLQEGRGRDAIGHPHQDSDASPADQARARTRTEAEEVDPPR